MDSSRNLRQMQNLFPALWEGILDKNKRVNVVSTRFHYPSIG